MELQLEQGEYYVINNTKKVLYWDGEKWMKPVKDNQKSFKGGFISILENQPKNIKSVTNVKNTELSGFYN